MTTETPKSEVVGSLGTYQVCFKSGATAVLDGVELVTFQPNGSIPPKPQYFFFQRGNDRISFTAHFVDTSEAGEKPLDDVIDAIFRLK